MEMSWQEHLEGELKKSDFGSAVGRELSDGWS